MRRGGQREKERRGKGEVGDAKRLHSSRFFVCLTLLVEMDLFFFSLSLSPVTPGLFICRPRCPVFGLGEMGKRS